MSAGQKEPSPTRKTPARSRPSGPNNVHLVKPRSPRPSVPTASPRGTHCVLAQARKTRLVLSNVPPLSCRHHAFGDVPAILRNPYGFRVLLRKEVIQPHLPVRLPCYDLVLITSPTFDDSLPRGVRPSASGVTDFHDLTGGVYKARERIHRSVADLRLLATPTSWGRVADPNPN